MHSFGLANTTSANDGMRILKDEFKIEIDLARAGWKYLFNKPLQLISLVRHMNRVSCNVCEKKFMSEIASDLRIDPDKVKPIGTYHEFASTIPCYLLLLKWANKARLKSEL